MRLPWTKQLIDSLLVERISLRGIRRVTGVSWSWLQNHVNHKYRSVPQQVTVSPKSKGRLTIECDEMWSFVFSKSFEVYIWLAIDCNAQENRTHFVRIRNKTIETKNSSY